MRRERTVAVRSARFLADFACILVAPLIVLAMRLDAWADDLGWRVGGSDR